jgi:hypothetical protein
VNGSPFERWMRLPALVLSAPRLALEAAQRVPPWWLGSIPVAVVAVLTAMAYDPRVYPGGDNALYWALGRSLAETLEYRDLGAPGAPYETSIPWGFPLLIAAGMQVLPDGYPYLKIVSWLSMAGAFACLWGFLRYLLPENRGVALLAMLLLAVNHRLLVFASLLLTEAPFLLFSMAALLAFEVYRRRWAERWWGVAPSALLASYGYLVRPAGVALVAALLGFLVLSRRWKATAVALGVVVLLAGSWHVRSVLVPSESENLYLSYLVKRSKYQTDESKAGVADLVARVSHNAQAYTRSPLHRLTVGTKWKDRTRLSPVVLPMLALIAVGFVFSLRRAGPVHLYVPLYLAVILLWLPESVKTRYLAMLFPLLLPLALYGLHRLLALRLPNVAAWAVLLAFLFMGYFHGVRMSRKVDSYTAVRQAYRAGEHEVRQRRSYRSYVQMCDWLRDNTPQDAVLGARKPRLAYLYSGRQAVRITFETDPAEVYPWLVDNGIDYVLLDRLDSQVEDTRIRMLATQLEYSDHFADMFSSFLGDRVARFSPDPAEIEAHRAEKAAYQRKLLNKRGREEFPPAPAGPGEADDTEDDGGEE